MSTNSVRSNFSYNPNPADDGIELVEKPGFNNRVVEHLPLNVDLKAWEGHLDGEIKGHTHLVSLASKERWKAIAKCVALVAGLIILLAVAIALLAPTPYALVLLPLAAVFLIQVCLPAAKKIKQWVIQARNEQSKLTLYSTSLNQLKECRKHLSEEVLRFLPLSAHPSTKDILKAYQDFRDDQCSSEQNMVFVPPPDLEL